MIPLLFLLSWLRLAIAFRPHEPRRASLNLLPAVMFAGMVLAACCFVPNPAQAGWFDWFGRDRKLEQANTALQHAADAVNESAKLQAGQNVQVLEAVQALSRERVQLAGHLQKLGQHAAEDSKLAAAVTLFAPTLIGVAVLAVGAYALRLAFRDEPTCEAALLELLMNKEVPPAAFSKQDVNPAREPRVASWKSFPEEPAHHFRKSRDFYDIPDTQEMPF